jgi:hypothetical protein
MKERHTIKQQVPHGTVTLGHLPVVHSDLGSLQPLPLWQAPSVNVSNLASVRNHRLFFEIADETMDGSGADEVSEEEGIAPHALGAQHHQTHKGPWLAHLQKGEKVHALVVALLEQALNPAAC